MTTQITLRELLRDPQFRAWFMTIPPPFQIRHNEPWRLYVQKEEGGRWARGDFSSYREAYSGVKSRLQKCHDMAIHCKPIGFKPPVVQFSGKRSYFPLPDDHLWCCYCRRPTVFGYFDFHPAMPRLILANYEARCSICGARSAGMRHYKPRFSWEQYREA